MSSSGNLSSSVDQSLKTELCLVGIDEAGRGPVLGPMVYGILVVPLSKKEELVKMKFKDSKTLKQETREDLFRQLSSKKCFCWKAKVLSPSDISSGMLRRHNYNLNAQAFDATVELIRQVMAEGIQIDAIYVDTLGPPETHRKKLSTIFPNIQITVEIKADSKFPIVSGASICAKVIRDKLLKEWSFSENILDHNFGTGYPSCPTTKSWLDNNVDDVFGFPSLVRFSWETTKKKMLKCKEVLWFLINLLEKNNFVQGRKQYFKKKKVKSFFS